MNLRSIFGLGDEPETIPVEPVEETAPPAPEPPGLEWWWLVEHRVEPRRRCQFVGGTSEPDFDVIPLTPEEEAKATPHPAFYLRTLMPGDFAPGRLPAPRHVRLLERPETGLPEEVRCGTCGEIPRAEDLEPIERQTGARGFLDAFRRGLAKWPQATRAESCWMCSGQAPATEQASARGTDITVCAGCAKHLERKTR